MWNPFKKPAKASALRGANLPSQTAPSVGLQAGASAVPPKSGVLRLHMVDCEFVARLMGGTVQHGKAPTPQEEKVLLSIRDGVRSADANVALPRLPAALPKLMGLLRREEVSVPELAAHLSHDPALLGETMRIANSSFYRSTRPVASVADAVQMIGQTGLRQLVTRVAIGPVFGAQQGHFSKIASGPLWEHAQRCAHACAWLRRGEDDAFDAYLAGMLASSGLIVMLRMLDREMLGHQAPAAADFYSAVHDCGVRLSVTVAQQWGLPQQVVQALVTREAQAHVAPLDPLALAVQRADRCAKLVMLHRLEATYEVSTQEDVACVQEILHSFEKPPNASV